LDCLFIVWIKYICSETICWDVMHCSLVEVCHLFGRPTASSFRNKCTFPPNVGKLLQTIHHIPEGINLCNISEADEVFVLRFADHRTFQGPYPFDLPEDE
jgi:hypothetical protein